MKDQHFFFIMQHTEIYVKVDGTLQLSFLLLRPGLKIFWGGRIVICFATELCHKYHLKSENSTSLLAIGEFSWRWDHFRHVLSEILRIFSDRIVDYSRIPTMEYLNDFDVFYYGEGITFRVNLLSFSFSSLTNEIRVICFQLTWSLRSLRWGYYAANTHPLLSLTTIFS